MISLEELSNMAILAFQNALRLHFDSILLYENDSYSSSVVLSILSMEEFGKYCSLSSYVFYTDVNHTRDLVFEEKYLKHLYNHPFKQRQIFGRDGFIVSTDLYNRAKHRFYEDLKHRALYVGYERDKGNLLFDKGINNPFLITKEIAKDQICFQNKLLINLVEERLEGIIEMDEEDVNEILNNELLQKLKSKHPN